MAIGIVIPPRRLRVGAKHFPISLFGSYSRLLSKGRSTKAISSNYLNAFGKIASGFCLSTARPSGQSKSSFCCLARWEIVQMLNDWDTRCPPKVAIRK